MSQQSPKVGSRIRYLREERGLSLRALAGKSGLSVNAIGMIERGENSPTVSSLHHLAEALEVKIVDFFQEPQEHATVFVKKNQRLATSSDDMLMESLGYGMRNQQLEPFLVTLHAGAAGPREGTPDRPGEPVEHPGEEFVYCISGEIVYEIGDIEYRLSPGDSLLFEATQSHRFYNVGTAEASMIMAFQASNGAYLARERHLGT